MERFDKKTKTKKAQSASKTGQADLSQPEKSLDR